jgi:LacI family gluconate utilization system Gnt-I transcriptional repressor
LDRVAYLPEVMGFAGGRIGLTELLAKWPELTAVIAATDVYAAGAMFECHRRGLQVPGDIAICGFGNAEVGRELTPALTTIDIHSYDMGRAAARLLLERLSGEVSANVVVDVGFKVIERESL